MGLPKSKQRAVSLLFVLGSILVMIAIWDFPDANQIGSGWSIRTPAPKTDGLYES